MPPTATPLPAVFGYAETNGRFLLVRHAFGRAKWHLPGGKMESGETQEQAVLREFKEETGLIAKVHSYAGSITTVGENTVHLFTLQIVGGEIRSTFDSEIGDIGFFMLSEMPEPLSDYVLERIRLCLVPGS